MTAEGPVETPVDHDIRLDEPLVRTPKLRTDDEEPGERRATWFELFFDLVFVVAIAELSRELVTNPTATGLGRFAGLFLPVWWAWVVFTFYADRFDTDDVPHRLLMGAGMVAMGAVAVTLPRVGHHGDVGFVAAYLVVRAIPMALYGRAGRHEELGRRIAKEYDLGSLAAAIVWIVSLAVGPPGRYWWWGVAVALELSLPLLRNRTHRRTPMSISHIPERFGLFFIVVLGQATIDLTTGTALHELTFAGATTALAGFLTAMVMWWLYFDFVPSRTLVTTLGRRHLLVYAHAPLLAGIVVFGAGVRLGVENAAHAGGGGLVGAWGVAGVATVLMVSSVLHLGATGWWGDPPLLTRLGAAALLVALAAASPVLPPVAIYGVVALVASGQLVIELTIGRRTARSERVREILRARYPDPAASEP